MIYFVTNREKKILEFIKNDFKSYHEIATNLNIRKHGVISTLNYFLKIDIVYKDRLRFMAKNIQFEEAPTNKVEAQRYKMINTIQREDEIQKYIPTMDNMTQVYNLLLDKIPRSEIAKKLNMTKSQLLWTLHEIENQRKTMESNVLMVDKLTYEVYKMLKKTDYTTLQLAKLLNRDVIEVRESIIFLIKNEAIKQSQNHNIINYIPLDKILRIKNGANK